MFSKPRHPAIKKAGLHCGFYIMAMLLSFPASGYAQTLHIAHCLQGCPGGVAVANELVVRHLFAVSINEQTRLADWVSYRVIDGALGVASLLPREWRDDELTLNGIRTDELDSEQVVSIQPGLQNQQDASYRINEFVINSSDRGRLVPMTSFAGSSYWSDLNLLSVMSLLKNDMRLGAWARLDQAVNSLVRETGEAYVLAGPIFENSGSPSLASSGASNFPTAFFKIIANAQGDMSVFIFDQNLPPHARYCEQIYDLAAVEARTGLDLFPQADGWPVGSLNPRLGC